MWIFFFYSTIMQNMDPTKTSFKDFRGLHAVTMFIDVTLGMYGLTSWGILVQMDH